MEPTPATWAGTTFISTLETSGAMPPGTYRPTRSMGTRRWVTVPPGTTSVVTSASSSASLVMPQPADRLLQRGADRRVERREGVVGGLDRHPDVGLLDAVEAGGELADGLEPALADGGDDRLDDGEGRGDVHLGARHRGAVVRAGVGVGSDGLATEVDSADHDTSLGRLTA